MSRMRNLVGIFMIGMLMGIAVGDENAENVAEDISTSQNSHVPNVRNRRAGWTADKPGCTAITARQAYENVGRTQRECLKKDTWNVPGASGPNGYVEQLMYQCDKSADFNNCLDKAISDNRDCLYKQYIDIARPRTKSYKAALEFFCDRKTGAEKCWASKSQAKERCTTSANNVMVSNMSQESAQCRRIEVFQSCMADELRSCDNSRVADVFNELWDATQMATPCSASAIANVIFVTLTTALISLRLI